MTYGDIIENVLDIIGTLDEPTRVKINCSEKDMETMLTVAYARACAVRGVEMEMNEETGRNIMEVARWMTDGETKPWLMMWGNIGSGKSTMATAINMVLTGLRMKSKERMIVTGDTEESDRVKVLLGGLPDIACVNAADLCYIAENRPEDYARMINVPLLIVDDLGTEPVYIKRYGTNTQPVLETMYDRYDNMLATVVTSNMDPDRIGKCYGERLKDRMKEMCTVLEFRHKSYRK